MKKKNSNTNFQSNFYFIFIVTDIELPNDKSRFKNGILDL